MTDIITINDQDALYPVNGRQRLPANGAGRQMWERGLSADPGGIG